MQIETDKAVVDIPSPKSGTILKINFREGETVKVGETLVVIGEEGEKVFGAKHEVKKEKPAVKNLEKEKSEVLEVQHSNHMKGEQQTQKVLAAPAIRKIASDSGIDLLKVKGSGEEGRILKKDLDQFVKKKEFEIKEKIPQQIIQVKRRYDEYGYLERIPLKGIRKTIAENMISSLKNSAQVTAMEDINVSKLWRIREYEKKNLEKQNIKLTFLPFIMKAVIAALKENPLLNSSIEGDEILVKKYYNIGVAVETEVGLMVPVIKKAEDKNIIQIAKEISELAEKARTRKIDLMDLKGGTFTITNYGSVGGTYGTPILNLGEAGILGLGRIFGRVVSVNGRFKVVKILPVSLTFDHRILDGAQAARFLESLRLFLEDPDHLLLELK